MMVVMDLTDLGFDRCRVIGQPIKSDAKVLGIQIKMSSFFFARV